MVAYYLKSMFGLDEIKVSAAARLLSNKAHCCTLRPTTHCRKGKQKYSFCANAETDPEVRFLLRF